MARLESSLQQAAARLPRASRALADRAEAEGLLDVAYTTSDTPFGSVLVAVTPRGLVRLAFLWGEDPEGVLDDLARRVSPRVLEAPKPLDPIRRELDEYFDGKRRRFDLSLDWSLSTGFAERVLRVTAAIPFGSTETYGGVAEQAGNPRAARAAGNALGANPIPIVVPCHRVVLTGGRTGHYGGGPDMKVALLKLEGALPG